MEYTVKTNDTFSTISRKIYGVETDALLISNANPGVIEPLNPGIIITIPNKPGTPEVINQNVESVQQNEVSLKIENELFRFWRTINISRSIDSFDTIGFTAPFEIENEEFREIFRPFSFKNISLNIGGEVLFKGTMLTPTPQVDANSKTISVSGYSLPGVLNDCTLPASAFPLEFEGQGLKDISKTIASYFGLGVEFTDQQGPVFDKVAVEPSEKPFQFLGKLARQRNFVISSTKDGELLFQRSVNRGRPVARLSQGVAPLLSVTPTFKSQEYYSHLTGLAPATAGIGGSQHTVENSRLKGIIRPFTFKANDTTSGDVKAAVEAKIGRMFANAASYTITLVGWRNSKGELWKPNTTITLIAPNAMIFSEYEFIIRKVTLKKAPKSETTELQLVMPGAFDGKIPEDLPWDL